MMGFSLSKSKLGGYFQHNPPKIGYGNSINIGTGIPSCVLERWQFEQSWLERLHRESAVDW